MSRKAAPVPETSARAAVLDKVFGKALDVSVNALGEEVMVDSFGDLKSVYGNQMDKLFRNMIGKTQANMEASYRDICIRNDVDEGLRKLEQAPPVPSSDALLSTEDPLTSTVAELRLLEAEKLRDAIKNIEGEVKKLQTQAVRLKSQLDLELTGATEESTKLQTTLH